jgi:hypothetical protein
MHADKPTPPEPRPTHRDGTRDDMRDGTGVATADVASVSPWSRRRVVTAVGACALLSSSLPGCRKRGERELQSLQFGRCQGDPAHQQALAQRAHVRRTGPAARGLMFPGSKGVKRTMRFRFTDPLPMYPATYLWRALPLRQAGYYTAFFWGNDDGRDGLETFLWDSGKADGYYGAHPYPDAIPLGDTHQGEISIEQTDTVNGRVDYGRWHTQAFRAWRDNAATHHEFHWDLPLRDDCHRVLHRARADWGQRAPPKPTLTWGDAPWAPGKEVWCGALRGLQIYADALSVDEVLAELDKPLSTSKGAASIWYLNLDPTPEDLGDRSGRNHHPQWVGDERPTLWVP